MERRRRRPDSCRRAEGRSQDLPEITAADSRQQKVDSLVWFSPRTSLHVPKRTQFSRISAGVEAKSGAPSLPCEPLSAPTPSVSTASFELHMERARLIELEKAGERSSALLLSTGELWIEFLPAESVGTCCVVCAGLRKVRCIWQSAGP